MIPQSIARRAIRRSSDSRSERACADGCHAATRLARPSALRACGRVDHSSGLCRRNRTPQVERQGSRRRGGPASRRRGSLVSSFARRRLSPAALPPRRSSATRITTVTPAFAGASMACQPRRQTARRRVASLAHPASRRDPVSDPRYAAHEKKRHGGIVRDAAVLSAIGIGPDERRRVLGASVALSEAEVHWRAFLESLQARGMRGVEYVISDDHAGLRAARRAVLGGANWQRRQFHLARNAIHHAPSLAIRKRIGAEPRAGLERGLSGEGRNRPRQARRDLPRHRPETRGMAGASVPEGLAVFALPERHRRRMRTSNPMERAVQQELKRRTVKVRVFPAKTPSSAWSPPSSSRSTKHGPRTPRPKSSGNVRMHDHAGAEFPDRRLLIAARTSPCGPDRTFGRRSPLGGARTARRGPHRASNPMRKAAVAYECRGTLEGAPTSPGAREVRSPQLEDDIPLRRRGRADMQLGRVRFDPCARTLETVVRTV